MQIKAPSLVRVVLIEQLFKSLHHILQIRLSTFRGRNIQDLACFVEGDAAGCEGSGGRGAAAGGLSVFLGGVGLTPGFFEGAAKDTSGAEHNLCDYAVGLCSSLVERHGVRSQGVRVACHVGVGVGVALSAVEWRYV